MKNIDIKSLIIGALLTSTIFLGVAATGEDDKGKWDKKQEWRVWVGIGEGPKGSPQETIGWEPIGAVGNGKYLWRMRTK